jgi:prepilin-type N-terminal cleavage/methylation domain-containing protein
MNRQSQQGFTLLELMLAMSILVVLLALALGGLRAALLPWERGQDRADAQQQVRSLTRMLGRAIEAANPYRAPVTQETPPALLFAGGPAGLSLVTADPPFPLPSPIAFTAVSIGIGEDPAGLVIRQKALPNHDPFEAVTPSLTDASVRELTFRYLRDGGGWEERWDAQSEGTLPRAVQVTVVTERDGRRTALPPLTIPIRVSGP